MNKEIFEKNWSDSEIIELSYIDNDIIKLKIQDYQENVFVYEFNNVFKLYFENYINEDISHIRYEIYQEDNEKICSISFVSAWSNKEIISFSFFIE